MKYLHPRLALVLFLLLPLRSFSQLKLRPLPKNGYESRIRNFVDKLDIVDTHEHLMEEAEVNKDSIDFMWMLFHYADDDIKSAGLGKSEFAELLTNKYSVTEKWKIIKPYWEASKNTAYNRTVLLALQRLYGLDDLNDNTFALVSEKLRASYDGKWYAHVLREKANIKYAIQDVGTRRNKEPYFRYVEKFDHFIRIHSKKEVTAMAAQAGAQISSLDDYVTLLEKSFQQAIDRRIIGVKSALAYHRILKYEDVPKSIADSVFNRLMRSENDQVFAFTDIKPFQDYIMHQVIGLVRKHNIPFQFHTGLQSGDGNIIDNANPSHLANLFLQYRDVNFVLFHGGFPYGGILSTQAKSFRNVYIDMCWSAVISPSYSERYLSEWIETVPSNKIMAFGGDYHNVESTYAHSLIARDIVANVLVEKVKAAYLTEEEATSIAARVLRDNAIALFKIE